MDLEEIKSCWLLFIDCLAPVTERAFFVFIPDKRNSIGFGEGGDRMKSTSSLEIIVSEADTVTDLKSIVYDLAIKLNYSSAPNPLAGTGKKRQCDYTPSVAPQLIVNQEPMR
jgi:hypothetical protein